MSNERLIPCKHSATINGWQEPLPNGTYKDINIVALRCENDMCGCYGGFCEPNCEKYEMPKGTYNFGNIEQLWMPIPEYKESE